ncbi:acyl-CoA thioesterase [Philodulcilactobacillus myokoensis]|uniref:Acyl-CoA thioesterase n=1 Tax=Philodulcilactobacillus myokoensis TaxID=2929573 RepID=A0A9W6B1Q6_9LACO|nr:SGNH/GDSL hydrolase family protein [Philodulcilactobacillus myokoensis]GLB47327.1 acyl-CoA thioesterase [Philodulcilactobacillus myokoensis]
MKHNLINGSLSVAGGMLVYQLAKKFCEFQRGNMLQYAPDQRYLKNDPIIRHQKIAFLGSSITYGFASHGDSFVDYLDQEYGVDTIKEAVSGTTLAGPSEHSYVNRMLKRISPDNDLDLFVCQLSTNDQRQDKPMGSVNASFNLDSFDRNTTIGAIEFIIAYVTRTWHCPVVFYTCLRKPEPDYELLMRKLKQVQDKWEIKIIDVAHNDEIKRLNREHPEFMFDDAHPTRMGYRYAWTPYFVKCLDQILK